MIRELSPAKILHSYNAGKRILRAFTIFESDDRRVSICLDKQYACSKSIICEAPPWLAGITPPHNPVATSLTAFSAINLLARYDHPKHVHATIKLISLTNWAFFCILRLGTLLV